MERSHIDKKELVEQELEPLYKAALRSIFSELLRQEKLIAIEHPKIKNPKTKEMVSFLSKLSLENVLIITDEIDKNLHLASRNIPHVNVVTTAEINPVMLLKPHKVAITPAAFKKIEELI